jgi:hypothetical protein
VSLDTPPPRGAVLRVIRTADDGRREVYGPAFISLWADKTFGSFRFGEDFIFVSLGWAGEGQEVYQVVDGPVTDPAELISVAMTLLGQARELLTERIDRAGS